MEKPFKLLNSRWTIGSAQYMKGPSFKPNRNNSFLKRKISKCLAFLPLVKLRRHKLTMTMLRSAGFWFGG